LVEVDREEEEREERGEGRAKPGMKQDVWDDAQLRIVWRECSESEGDAECNDDGNDDSDSDSDSDGDNVINWDSPKQLSRD
jgi:hypothetical protein